MQLAAGRRVEGSGAHARGAAGGRAGLGRRQQVRRRCLVCRRGGHEGRQAGLLRLRGKRPRWQAARRTKGGHAGAGNAGVAGCAVRQPHHRGRRHPRRRRRRQLLLRACLVASAVCRCHAAVWLVGRRRRAAGQGGPTHGPRDARGRWRQRLPASMRLDVGLRLAAGGGKDRLDGGGGAAGWRRQLQGLQACRQGHVHTRENVRNRPACRQLDAADGSMQAQALHAAQAEQPAHQGVQRRLAAAEARLAAAAGSQGAAEARLAAAAGSQGAAEERRGGEAAHQAAAAAHHAEAAGQLLWCPWEWAAGWYLLWRRHRPAPREDAALREPTHQQRQPPAVRRQTTAERWEVKEEARQARKAWHAGTHGAHARIQGRGVHSRQPCDCFQLPRTWPPSPTAPPSPAPP